MVVVGNFRNRAELRKNPRRAFHYDASILIKGAEGPLPCAISDISETGARIHVESDGEIPDQFMLLLTKRGSARRNCHVVWRNGSELGVEFPEKPQP